MRWRFDGAAQALHSPIPWVALSAALALTAAGWAAIERNRQDEARAQFERRTETAEAAVRTRMLAYEQILRSGAAFEASASTISRAQWRDFISRLQLDERFPGIQAVGYAERVKPAERAAHVKRVRAEGLPDYDVRPDPGDADAFPIVYNEPAVGRNLRVLGFDIGSERTRRVAMEKARDTADVAVTGRVVLAGEAYRGADGQQPGFVMFVPVFRRDARQLSPSERDAELIGYVFGPFRMHDLLRGVLDEGMLQVIDMRIFDSLDMRSDSELIDTRTAWRATPASAPPMFTRQVAFQMPGRLWTLQFSSRPEFDATLQASRPWGLLVAGILTSTILFFLTTSLVSAWSRAHDLSMRDPLTGLYNRRYLEETMQREIPRARRHGESVGVIVLDLDLFKQLNDTFGHDAGDHVLERVADLLRAATRGSDIACRFGGEEFAVILPGATLLVARNRAEGIRAALESMKLEFDGKPLGPITVSAGVASMPPHGQDWGLTLQQADRALYTAKQAGRNRVVAAVDD